MQLDIRDFLHLKAWAIQLHMLYCISNIHISLTQIILPTYIFHIPRLWLGF